MSYQAHAGSFIAMDNEGNKMVLHQYVEKANISNADNAGATITGSAIIKTLTGEPVVRLSKGEYKIASTGQVLHSNDFNAP